MFTKGFTLIETLVSLVIFLLIALAVTFGLQHAVDGNVFDSQRQDVINATQSVLDNSTPPDQLCPAVGSTATYPEMTTSGLAFSINVTCTVDPVPMPYPTPSATSTVSVTEMTVVATWSTFGQTRHVTLQQ